MAWTLYRIIKGRESTPLDFTSFAAQGIPSRFDDPEVMRLWSGISCLATEAQARRAMRRYPSLGTHIVALQIPDDAPVIVERTRGPGHHTVWGEPETIASFAGPAIPGS